MSNSEFQFGFIGVGTMGESMCENILTKSKQTVYIYDVNPDQMKKMETLGATPCTTIKDVAEQANLIFIMVPNNEHVEAVVDEIIPSLKKGTIICDMSSISPAVERECGKKITQAGGIPIEAPVVKSKAAAIDGSLGILAAGDKATVEKVTPILLYMGAKVIYYGENGNGMIMKILHNMLVGNIQNGVNEMFTMAGAAGLDFDLVMQGIRAGGGQNAYLDGKGPTIMAENYDPKFSVRNMAKDTRLHGQLKDQLGLDLPGSDRVREIYEQALEEFPNEDFSATYKIVKRIAKKN